MESTDLRMEELFETDAIDDGDLGAMAPMPDLDGDDGPMRQNENDDDEDGEVNEDVLKHLKDLKGAAKKRVLRPQPKLDVDRLKTNRGLPELSDIFENTKFKGRGHEADDLKLMMGKLEHWAHRLFPKMTFDEFIERLERLGQKRGVQTCLRKIRLGMPLLEEDMVDQVEGEEEVEQPEEDGVDARPEDDIDAEEAFEEMLRKERENRQREGNQQNGGDDSGVTAPSDGNAKQKSGMDQQTEAEILAALDSDDDWDEDVIDTQSEKTTKEKAADDKLNLRLTATEDSEENISQETNHSLSGVTKESSQQSLKLHLTPTEGHTNENSSDQGSQNTDLNLHLTESEDIDSESKSSKSNSQTQEEGQDSKKSSSKNNVDSEENLNLHLTETEHNETCDKTKKNSITDEQEGNELNLNLSTSDSEMTADES